MIACITCVIEHVYDQYIEERPDAIVEEENDLIFISNKEGPGNIKDRLFPTKL